MSERARDQLLSVDGFDLMSDSTGGWYKLIGGLGGQHKGSLNILYHGSIFIDKKCAKMTNNDATIKLPP